MLWYDGSGSLPSPAKRRPRRLTAEHCGEHHHEDRVAGAEGPSKGHGSQDPGLPQPQPGPGPHYVHRASQPMRPRPPPAPRPEPPGIGARERQLGNAQAAGMYGWSPGVMAVGVLPLGSHCSLGPLLAGHRGLSLSLRRCLMATTIPSAALVPITPVFTNTERLALAGFLAGYSGLTRQAYELDLRQFASWCQQHQLHLFQARRADIEFFARNLEARGRARATITRRLCTVTGFYRYAVEEELLDHSPAAHVRRPRLDYESHAVGLDRNELGALLAPISSSIWLGGPGSPGPTGLAGWTVPSRGFTVRRGPDCWAAGLPARSGRPGRWPGPGPVAAAWPGCWPRGS